MLLNTTLVTISALPYAFNFSAHFPDIYCKTGLLVHKCLHLGEIGSKRDKRGKKTIQMVRFNSFSENI